MSVYSDYAVGALSDAEFKFVSCREAQEDEYYEDDDFHACCHWDCGECSLGHFYCTDNYRCGDFY